MVVDHLTDDPLVSAKTVRQEFDEISDMTLWRWIEDEALNFPKPIYIRRRRFWRQSEIQKFKESVATRRRNSTSDLSEGA